MLIDNIVITRNHLFHKSLFLMAHASVTSQKEVDNSKVSLFNIISFLLPVLPLKNKKKNCDKCSISY